MARTVLKKTEYVSKNQCFLGGNMKSIMKMEFYQESYALLDESEVVYYFCIRSSDGMAVIEREYKDDNGKNKYRFEIVEATRVRRISHDKRQSLAEIFTVVEEGEL